MVPKDAYGFSEETWTRLKRCVFINEKSKKKSVHTEGHAQDTKASGLQTAPLDHSAGGLRDNNPGRPTPPPRNSITSWGRRRTRRRGEAAGAEEGVGERNGGSANGHNVTRPGPPRSC